MSAAISASISAAFCRISRVSPVMDPATVCATDKVAMLSSQFLKNIQKQSELEETQSKLDTRLQSLERIQVIVDDRLRHCCGLVLRSNHKSVQDDMQNRIGIIEKQLDGKLGPHHAKKVFDALDKVEKDAALHTNEEVTRLIQLHEELALSTRNAVSTEWMPKYNKLLHNVKECDAALRVQISKSDEQASLCNKQMETLDSTLKALLGEVQADRESVTECDATLRIHISQSDETATLFKKQMERMMERMRKLDSTFEAVLGQVQTEGEWSALWWTCHQAIQLLTGQIERVEASIRDGEGEGGLML